LTHSFEANIGSERFPIIIGNDVFKQLIAFIKTYSKENILIISDSYFKDLSISEMKELSFIFEYNHIFINGGIESKTLPNFEKILKILVRKNIARDGLLVAIGGGVIGDLCAFIASCYQRGIDFIHVPTTTTAMIDSSIGGKTGLNYLDQVNLIGTYYNPKAIFMDLRFLNSLDERDFNSGICESIKMSITSDAEMFKRYFDIYDLVAMKDQKTLEEIVYWSTITKLKHVSGDFKEKSIRLILNYGHTFGQSIESYYGLYQDKLKHGEAVALGITVAAKLSDLIFKTYESKRLWDQTNEILLKYNLPNKFDKIMTDDIPKISYLIKNIINDKKRISSGNRFILCESLGKANIKIIKDNLLIQDAFKSIY